MSTTCTQCDRAPSIHELDALLGFIPVAGPPAFLVAGPLILAGLLLAGPFVLMLTLAVVVLLAIAIIAIAGLLLASPYLLVRHFRARSVRSVAAPATIRRPAPSVVRPISRSIAA